MTGILILESLTRGNTLKQGDKTPLTYKLLDADGDNLSIAGKTATVRLVHPNYLTIGYEKTGLTVQTDDTVTFTIDKIIPARKYHVEIIVDDKFVFPSRSVESKFTIDRSSLGTESNIIEIVGKDVLIRAVKSQVDTDLQPLVTSLQAAQQAETQRASEETSRASAETQRKTDHANRSAELAGKADKVVIENLIENGDFSSSAGWVARGGATLSIADGIATFNTTANYTGMQRTGIPLTTGHKYYYGSNVKGGNNIYIGLTGITGEYYIDAINEWGYLSGITEATSGTGTLFIRHSTPVTGVLVDDVLMIDLTETFGAGNEPTKEEMDRLIEVTGYIDGEYALNNKEMLNYLMQADKVVIENLVKNGDFSDGIDGWVPSRSNLSLVNSKLNVTGDGTSPLIRASYSIETNPSVNTKLYVYGKLQLPTGVPSRLGVMLRDGLAGTVITETLEVAPNNNEYVFSDMGEITSPLSDNLTFFVTAQYPTATDSNGSVMLADDILLINLTEIFGVGNEPTKEEMDEIIKATGYIDGEYTLNNKELLRYLTGGKANKKQEDWITPTLVNGATGTVQYRKNDFGRVEFRGYVNKAQSSHVFSLPPAYQPDWDNETRLWVDLKVSGRMAGDTAPTKIDSGFNIYTINDAPFHLGGLSYSARED